jgi:hypothetical protein
MLTNNIADSEVLNEVYQIAMKTDFASGALDRRGLRLGRPGGGPTVAGTENSPFRSRLAVAPVGPVQGPVRLKFIHSLIIPVSTRRGPSRLSQPSLASPSPEAGPSRVSPSRPQACAWLEPFTH